MSLDTSDTRVIHRVAVGNTSRPLGVVCKRPDGTIADLTGKTAKFYAVNEDGSEAIAEVTTDITDADSGEAQYDFEDVDVEEAKTMYGYFNIYDGSGEVERFPVKARDLTIVVYGDT